MHHTKSMTAKVRITSIMFFQQLVLVTSGKLITTVIIYHISSSTLQDIIAEDLNMHGTLVIPIILGSDKTTVSVTTGNNEYLLVLEYIFHCLDSLD